MGPRDRPHLDPGKGPPVALYETARADAGIGEVSAAGLHLHEHLVERGYDAVRGTRYRLGYGELLTLNRAHLADIPDDDIFTLMHGSSCGALHLDAVAHWIGTHSQIGTRAQWPPPHRMSDAAELNRLANQYPDKRREDR